MSSSGRPKSQATVTAQVFLRSVSGQSIRELADASALGDLAPFRASPAVRAGAIQHFEDLGFKVFEDQMGLMLSIEGTPALFKNVFGVSDRQIAQTSPTETVRLRAPDGLAATVEDILLMPRPEMH